MNISLKVKINKRNPSVVIHNVYVHQLPDIGHTITLSKLDWKVKVLDVNHGGSQSEAGIKKPTLICELHVSAKDKDLFRSRKLQVQTLRDQSNNALNYSSL